MTNEEVIEILLHRVKCPKGQHDVVRIVWEDDIVCQAIDMAVEALEKHSLKKPIWQGDAMCPEPYCPNCGEYLDDGEEICDECTQLIDWSIGWCDDEN